MASKKGSASARVAIHASSSLCQSAAGNALLQHLTDKTASDENQSQLRVASSADLRVPCLYFSRSCGGATSSAAAAADVHLIAVVPMQDVAAKVKTGQLRTWMESLRHSVSNCLSSDRDQEPPSSFRCILFICGYEAHFRALASKLDREKKRLASSLSGDVAAAVAEQVVGGVSDPEAERYNFDRVMIDAQLSNTCEYFTFDAEAKKSSGGGGWDKLAAFGWHLVRAVVEAEEKTNKADSAANFQFWPHDGGSKCAVSKDSGVGLMNVWQDFLSLASVQGGHEKAKAIAAKHPSPRSLLTAIKRADTQSSAELGLSELESRRCNDPLGGRLKVGHDTAKKVVKMMTESDGRMTLTNHNSTQ